jgi:ribose/xylose/arabinose/galactoside ABC-type transport system permease subunit
MDSGRVRFPGLRFLKKYTLFVILFAIVAIIAITSPDFRTLSNMLNIGRQVSVLAIVSLGMTFVIATAGIDLSVGSFLAFSGILMASLMKETDFVVVSILLGVVSCGLLGLFNGAMIVKFRIPPFIATLGTMGIVRGLALVFTDGRPITLLPERFTNLGYSSIAGVPILVILLAISIAVSLFLYNSTKIGVYACAIGGNEESARLSGMNVGAYKMGIYTLAGLLTGVGSVAYLARVGSAHPTAGLGLELEVIAAAVIGGTSLEGGKGNLVGTVLGAIVVGVLRNGLTIMGVSSYWQQVATGVIIMIAVGIEQYGRRAAK